MIIVPDLKEVPRSGAQASLAFVVLFAFIGVLILWTFVPPPGDPAQISGMMNTLIGILAAAATAIVGFYFGSSDSSKRKDETLSDIAKSNKGTPNVGTGNGAGTPSTVIVEPPSTVIIEKEDDLGDPPKAKHG